jgi:hypothetical protein
MPQRRKEGRAIEASLALYKHSMLPKMLPFGSWTYLKL